MYFKTEIPSPVGKLTLACTGDGKSLAGLWLEGQKYFGGGIADAMTKNIPENKNQPVFAEAKNWLEKYFAGEAPAISEIRLAPVGSEFRRDVWKILCEIPYGETVTYGDIAKRIAAKMNRSSMSAQAVGGAVGHNHISIIIPCHRVVGADGSLTGYAGGIEVKKKLLELERGL